jgi:hypothetical protein
MNSKPLLSKENAMTLCFLVNWGTTKQLRQSSVCLLWVTTALTVLSLLVMIPRGYSLEIARRLSCRRVDLLRLPVPSFYYHASSSRYFSSFQRPRPAAVFAPTTTTTLRARGNSFDAMDDESQGFGAFDYVPDEYDWQDMNSDNNLFPDDGYDVNSEDEYDSNVNAAGAGWEEPNTAWNTNQPRKRQQQGPWKKTPVVNGSKRESQTTQQSELKLELTSSNKIEEALPTTAAAINPRKTTESPTETTTTTTPETDLRLSRASKGIGMSTELDVMEEQLQRILQKIAIEASNNKYPNLNPNSPRQVSEALFGIEGESTGKDVLEALASSKSNKKHLADLILQFRHLARDIAKRKKRQENKEKGTLAKSVHAVKRNIQTTTTTSTTSPITSAEEKDHQKTVSSKQTDLKARPTGTPEDPLLLVDASAYIYRA